MKMTFTHLNPEGPLIYNHTWKSQSKSLYVKSLTRKCWLVCYKNNRNNVDHNFAKPGKHKITFERQCLCQTRPFQGRFDKKCTSALYAGCSDSALSAIRYRSKQCAGDDAKAEPKTILQTILAVCKDNCHVGQLQGFTQVPELANQSAPAQNLSSFGNTQFVTKALTSRLEVAQLTENFPLHSNFWGWRKYSDHKTKLPFFCKWLSNICSLFL